jgi:hypothetical protein
MHVLIYYIVKHLIRGLVIVAQHLVHHAPAAHTAIRHAAAAHTVAASSLGGTRLAGAGVVSAMPAARAGTIPLSSTAAALHGFNQQSNIMASVGAQQAAAIPDVGDFSY